MTSLFIIPTHLHISQALICQDCSFFRKIYTLKIQTIISKYNCFRFNSLRIYVYQHIYTHQNISYIYDACISINKTYFDNVKKKCSSLLHLGLWVFRRFFSLSLALSSLHITCLRMCMCLHACVYVLTLILLGMP